ncbi:GNAT family N-acetyltransferase [Paracoccus sediminis]|uniref:GNAT family N-acetyltransferase n=1 Tax=Paracoccus sediminis TaxID=1214787 RepID=A0A238UME0_9RHOB|nr:GNAT family N-acetyltransferase [Paracoccus sediminis]TBN53088.1 GNAT family N-acetyltransferase [Paracoccus sediminis]SNR23198.1 ribosomal-protein-alanine N-acetyltransferase [Paracoccus sediminis]
MTPGQLAALHARCFTHPRPWNSAEFASLLDSPHVFALSRPRGFLLGRAVADQAELLTLAVAPDARRQGIGRDLVDDFAATSRRRGALRAFLEVAADNIPAQALYRAAGWQHAGRRRRYYGADLDAVVMALPLQPGQQGG